MSASLGGVPSCASGVGLRRSGGVLPEPVDPQEVGELVERAGVVAHPLGEVQEQPLLTRELRQPALELRAVEAADHHALAVHGPLAGAGRHPVEHRLVVVLLDGPAELRVGVLLLAPHRPLRERPLDRVAEARHQQHLRVEGAHPLQGARPQDVRRRRVDRDLLLLLGLAAVVVRVVRRATSRAPRRRRSAAPCPRSATCGRPGRGRSGTSARPGGAGSASCAWCSSRPSARRRSRR